MFRVFRHMFPPATASTRSFAVDQSMVQLEHIRLSKYHYKTLRKTLMKAAKHHSIRRKAEENCISRKELNRAIVDFNSFGFIRTLPAEVVSSIISRDSKSSDQAVKKLMKKEFMEILQGPRKKQSKVEMEQVLEQILDMRLPHELYPLARSIKRKIILHRGPTNSGKTYRALLRLQESSSGIYCGPLRLLAWEVYDKLSTNSIPCKLLTGQEMVKPPNAKHVSCTVEMANLSERYECAVIDEIQMIGNMERGSAFTQAFLGLAADELHLCGDVATVELVQELCAITGDSLEIRNYERLGSLEVQESLGGIQEVQEGDCIVAFSRKDIYELKEKIEQNTKYKACVVYGNLPPDIRKSQAKLFNDENSPYKILIASDAIGMGLNLNIKRIIFSSIRKFDGIEKRELAVTEVLQIGGRAGRFSSDFPVGYVASLQDDNATDFLRKSMFETPPMIEKAGLSPPLELLQALGAKFPEYPFSKLLRLSAEYASLDGTYFMCDLSDTVKIAKAIDDLPFSISLRYSICSAPVDFTSKLIAHRFPLDMKRFAAGMEIPLNIRIPEKLADSSMALMTMESMHKYLELYTWLSLRYPDKFVNGLDSVESSGKLAFLIERSLQNMGRNHALIYNGG